MKPEKKDPVPTTSTRAGGASAPAVTKAQVPRKRKAAEVADADEYEEEAPAASTGSTASNVKVLWAFDEELLCDQCQVTGRECVREEGKQHCEYCQSRHIQCCFAGLNTLGEIKRKFCFLFLLFFLAHADASSSRQAQDPRSA